jgi:hypothetical protein
MLTAPHIKLLYNLPIHNLLYYRSSYMCSILLVIVTLQTQRSMISTTEHRAPRARSIDEDSHISKFAKEIMRIPLKCCLRLDSNLLLELIPKHAQYNNNLTLYLLTQYKSIYYSTFRTKQLNVSTRRI